MKLSQNLNDALNQQILKELANQIKYMQMESYFENLQLKNLAKFFKIQSDGEHDHAHLFMDHINDRNGGNVDLGEVVTPMVNMTDPISVIEDYIKGEQDTTASIEELYDMAFSEKSFIDLPFLSTMLDEQVEEEDISQRLGENLRMCKDIVLFDVAFEQA